MKFVLIFSLFMILLTSGLASVGIGNYSDPNHPDKCVLNTNLILSPGEKIKDPFRPCGRVMCGSKGMVWFYSCGVLSINMPGCTLGDYADTSRDYPDCCRRKLVCPDNKDLDGKEF